MWLAFELLIRIFLNVSVSIGAYSDDKVRPLLISMTGEDTRDGILRMGKDLGLSGRRCSRIGIAPDFTPKQREENRKLLEEAKAAIIANGESPENYKLYVTRRSTRPEVITRKPCCSKETARCRKCSFLLKFANNIHYK